MFRAVDIKTGELVYGYWVYDIAQGKHYIRRQLHKAPYVWEWTDTKVRPNSLAMKTGRQDNHKVDIYGSFKVDGKMSEGGDRVGKVNGFEWSVVWDINLLRWDCIGEYDSGQGLGCRQSHSLEIIGSQYDERQK